jgi:hypothetical protein
MAITYTWKIDMIHTQSKSGFENGVTEIHWSKTGTDETGVKGRYPGYTKYSVDELVAKKEAGSFVAFNTLTEAQVIEWVQNGISRGDMDFINTQIQASINSQKTPRSAGSFDSKDFPWATN